MTPTTLKIIEQGEPIVTPDSARVVARGEKVAAVVVDMESKWCEAWRGVTNEVLKLALMPTEHSINLDTTKGGVTIIAFPDFPGWEVFAAEISKATLFVTLIHRDWRTA